MILCPDVATEHAFTAMAGVRTKSGRISKRREDPYSVSMGTDVWEAAFDETGFYALVSEEEHASDQQQSMQQWLFEPQEEVPESDSDEEHRDSSFTTEARQEARGAGKSPPAKRYG